MNKQEILMKSKIKKNTEWTVFFDAVTIIAETIELVMNDIGSPWDVKHFPKHKIWLLNYWKIFNNTYSN